MGRSVQGPWRVGQHRRNPDPVTARGEQCAGALLGAGARAQFQPVLKRALWCKQRGGEGVWAGAGSDLCSPGGQAPSVGLLIVGAKAFRESTRAGHSGQHHALLTLGSSDPLFASLKQLFWNTRGVMGTGF